MPPLEEHGVGLPLADVNVLRVLTVMEAEGIAPATAILCLLIKVRPTAEINTCGMADHGYCASDSPTEARLFFFYYIYFLKCIITKRYIFFILPIYAGLINNNYKVLYIHYYNYPLMFITYIAKFL